MNTCKHSLSKPSSFPFHFKHEVFDFKGHLLFRSCRFRLPLMIPLKLTDKYPLKLQGSNRVQSMWKINLYCAIITKHRRTHICPIFIQLRHFFEGGTGVFLPQGIILLATGTFAARLRQDKRNRGGFENGIPFGYD